MITKVVDVEAN